MVEQWLLCVVEGAKFASSEFVDGRYHLTPPGGKTGHDRKTGIPYDPEFGTVPDLDALELDELEEEE